MMRLFLLLLGIVVMPEMTVAADLPLVAKTFKSPDGGTLPYRFLTPSKVEPGEKYPLVIFLHGAGERGTDNTKPMIHGVAEFTKPEIRGKFPCYMIVPQCPEGARWVEVDWSADSHKQPVEPSKPLRATLELIDVTLKEFPIDPKRVVITGLSMGGYGTFDAVARRPELFAAAAPVCGGADEATAAQLAKVPMWVFHGGKDTVVKPARSRNAVEAIKKAGGNVKYTEYPSVGHDSWNPAYRDPALLEWLLTAKQK